MKETTYTIKNRLGINPRPALQFTKLMAGFESAIMFYRGDVMCNGKDLYELINLQVRMNDIVSVQTVGIDEDAAIAAVVDFLKGHL